jgi:hypothetical protein
MKSKALYGLSLLGIVLFLLVPGLSALLSSLLVGWITYTVLSVVLRVAANGPDRTLSESSEIMEVHHHYVSYNSYTEGHQQEEHLPDGRVIRHQHVRRWQ